MRDTRVSTNRTHCHREPATSTVLITGANRGLGLAFAQQYAAEGSRVIATCREPDRAAALRAIMPAVECHRLDVADVAAIRALGHRLAGETIDLLIANAGVMSVPPDTPLEAIDPAGWLHDFQVNAIAPLACASAFLPQVARSRGRTMVAISSRVGSIAANPTGGHYAYRSSKTALNSAWCAFAIDHPEVIATLLSPGLVRTDMTRDDPPRWQAGGTPEDRAAALRGIIARLTTADSGSFIHVTGEKLPW